MAEEKKVAYQNIKTLKQLQEEEYLPSLKKKMCDTKKELDTILKELKDREKELTRIRQEARQAESAKAQEAAAPQVEAPTVVEKSEVKPLPVQEAPKEVVKEQTQTQETPAPEQKLAEERQEKIVYQPRQDRPQYGDRPQYNNQGQRPPYNQGDRPQYNNQGQRPPYNQGDRPQYNNQGQRPPYNQGDRPQYNNQGQRPPYNQGDRPQYNNQGQRPPYNQGDRPQYNNQGQRPPYNQGDRPQYNNQGQRPPYNQGDRPQYNNQGQRPPYTPGQRPPYTPGQRPPFGQRPDSRPSLLPKPDLTPPGADKTKKIFVEKKKVASKQQVDDKKGMNKKALIKKGFVDTYSDEDRMGSRKLKSKKHKEFIMPTSIKIEHAVVNSEIVPIKVLSEKIGITAVEITKKLFKEGIIKTINDALDFDTAEFIAADIGVTLELKMDKTAEENMLEKFIPQDESDVEMVSRPPIVTVMGHVDHGKTSLLDAIRKTNVTAGEAGGITQHIGAYTIRANKRDITFIDTPGHEAFTAMRKRGAEVTDIAILVVAADDGVMPQTIEAISHAKAAKVPMIVAVNKMDKPTANPEKIKQQLADHEVLCEEWGGDVIMVPVSAHTKEGIENLLEMILLVADVRELKANPERPAKGTIIEAKLDKGRGPLASIIVQTGTLKVGDIVIAGTATGKIRAMIDDKGRTVKEAGPSYAVSVLGFSEVPQAGDELHVVADEKVARTVSDERKDKVRVVSNMTLNKVTLDDMFDRITEGQMKGLNVIVKADVQGSVEALRQGLLKLNNEEVKINIVHGGVGSVTESDVMLAATSKAIIIAFDVRPDAKAKQTAERDGVDIRTYKIIYEVLSDIQKAMKGMLAPKFREVITGKAEVRQTIKVSAVGTIAGCYVLDGKIGRGNGVRVFRGEEKLFEGKLSSLKRFKDDVKEVASGYECGMTIDGFNDMQEGDIFECFVEEQIKEKE